MILAPLPYILKLILFPNPNFGLVWFYLFNSISTFVRYLMPKPFS